jgi:hypothetical protein
MRRRIEYWSEVRIVVDKVVLVEYVEVALAAVEVALAAVVDKVVLVEYVEVALAAVEVALAAVVAVVLAP